LAVTAWRQDVALFPAHIACHRRGMTIIWPKEKDFPPDFDNMCRWYTRSKGLSSLWIR